MRFACAISPCEIFRIFRATIRTYCLTRSIDLSPFSLFATFDLARPGQRSLFGRAFRSTRIGVECKSREGTFNWKVNPTMGHDYSRLCGNPVPDTRSFAANCFKSRIVPKSGLTRVLRSRYLRKHFRSLTARRCAPGSISAKVPTYIF